MMNIRSSEFCPLPYAIGYKLFASGFCHTR